MLVETIQEVCQYPPKSLQRRKAMNKLLIEIQQLPKLGKSSSLYRLDGEQVNYVRTEVLLGKNSIVKIGASMF